MGNNSTSIATGECIELSSLCDGIQDCSNGEDEVSPQRIALAPVESIQQNALLEPEHNNFGYLKVMLLSLLVQEFDPPYYNKTGNIRMDQKWSRLDHFRSNHRKVFQKIIKNVSINKILIDK